MAALSRELPSAIRSEGLAANAVADVSRAANSWATDARTGNRLVGMEEAADSSSDTKGSLTSVER